MCKQLPWEKGLPDLLKLPADRPSPAVQTFRGAYQAITFPPDLYKSLETLSRQEGVILFMTLLAAFKVLLYRYTGQTDIAVGSPVTNRNREELEGLSKMNPPPRTKAEDLAYVMYTSGSTGRPKGVEVPRRGVVRLVCNTDYIQLCAADRVAHTYPNWSKGSV